MAEFYLNNVYDTRGGEDRVRIVAVLEDGRMIGLVEGTDQAITYYSNGAVRTYGLADASPYDLIRPAKVAYVNVMRSRTAGMIVGGVWRSREEADRKAGDTKNRIACVKIVEGQFDE